MLKITQTPAQQRELEIEIKLHINQRFYDQGVITESMYTKAKELIYKPAENK